MPELLRQLERIRGRARLLLVGQRLAQLLAAVLLAAVALGLLDFALRLPPVIRLIVGVGLVVAALVWAVQRFRLALSFHPQLATLALRAERLFPQLRGKLATAVEFTAASREYENPQRTAALAAASVAELRRLMPGVPLQRLLETTPTLRWAGVALLAVVVTGAVVGVAPAHALLALQRWALPYGEAQWPRRVDVRSELAQGVWPLDTPLLVEATVARGHYRGMRASVHFRLHHGDGGSSAWQSALMSDQAIGRARAGANSSAATGRDGAQPGTRYERLLDLAEIAAAVGDAARPGDTLELYFAAGDDQTSAQEVRLVDRPALTRFEVAVDPPAYAAGLVSPQRSDLAEQSGELVSLSALQGSTVRAELSFNTAVAVDPALPWNQQVAPGLPADAAVDWPSPAAVTATFPLAATLQTPVAVRDAYGLPSDSDRLYRLEAVVDQPPGATLLRPAADEAVLATAVVDLEAAGQDDVGLARLHIEAQHPQRSAEEPTAAPQLVTVELAHADARRTTLRVAHQLDLAPLALQVGDAVTLTAVAQDVFELNGVRHDPARSSPRVLRVIDPATLIGQIRNDLATLRQQVVRLEANQQQLIDRDPAEAGLADQQRQQRDRVASQRQVTDALRRRMQSNRLEEPALREVVDQADGMLQRAADEAQDAGQQLRDAQQQDKQGRKDAAQQQREQARQKQEQARRTLSDLANLLDQGRDALTLQLQLRQLLTQQETAGDDTRKLLPRTAGLRPEDLPQEDQQQLRELGERQQSLSRQAQELTRQMQATSEALRRQSERDADQAAADALRDAAKIAQQQGLSSQMSQAASKAQQNQLSEASNLQTDSAETMRRMLDELGTQPQRRMEILRRRLAQLAELIRKLVEQQNGQLQRLEAAEVVAALDEGMFALRRNTMAAQEKAAGEEATRPVAAELDRAAAAQGEAVLALRAEQRAGAAEAEKQSLAHLEAALKLVQEQARQQQQQQTDEQRAELEQEYRKLAATQGELRQRAEALVKIEQLNRRQRADLVQVGQEQADLKQAAGELRQKVEQTEVFVQQHRRIDELAGRAARTLRAAESDRSVLPTQQSIETRLTMMADALKQVREDAKFRNQEGQGGGGGGGGQPPPLVPPIAELRLLRGLQAQVYEDTRALEGQPDAATLQELAAQQRELGDTGQRLIEKLQNPTGDMPQPDGQEGQ